MNSKAIPIPDYFNLVWYREQKSQGLSDVKVAQSLFIGYHTLQKWKKTMGWIPGEGHQYAGRKPVYDVDKIKELKKQGYTVTQIAAQFGVWEGTIRQYLKR
jgi:transposase